jgi:arginine repressor
MGDDHEVRIFAGRWSPAERAEILAELAQREITATIAGDDLVVARHRQREVDMIVESVTEE